MCTFVKNAGCLCSFREHVVSVQQFGRILLVTNTDVYRIILLNPTPFGFLPDKLHKYVLNLFCWYNRNWTQTELSDFRHKQNPREDQSEPFTQQPLQQHADCPCVYLLVGALLHWLLGQPSRTEHGEGGRGFLPVTHTVVTETLRVHAVTSGCMQSAMQTVVRGAVCLCPCAHVAACLNTPLLPKESPSRCTLPVTVTMTTLTGSSDRHLKWCLSLPGVASHPSPSCLPGSPSPLRTSH